MDNSKYPLLGFGLGLRKEHYQTIIDAFSGTDEEKPLNIEWFEVLTENY